PDPEAGGSLRAPLRDAWSPPASGSILTIVRRQGKSNLSMRQAVLRRRSGPVRTMSSEWLRSKDARYAHRVRRRRTGDHRGLDHRPDRPARTARQAGAEQAHLLRALA